MADFTDLAGFGLTCQRILTLIFIIDLQILIQFIRWISIISLSCYCYQ